MYKWIVEKARDGICIIQDGIIKYANPRFLEMGGYKKKEVIGKPFIQFIVPYERKKLMKNYKKIKDPRYPGLYETVLIGKEDRKKFIQIMSTVTKYKNETAELIIIRDITEKRKLEIELKESEEKFRSLLEAIRDGVIITDSAGRIVFWNKGAKNLFGYSKKEIIGKSVDILLPEAYRKKHRMGMKDSFKIKKCKYSGKTKEVIGMKKNGDKIPVEISFSYWKKDNNVYFISIVRDVSEKKKLAEELKEERNLFIEGPVVAFKWKAGEKQIPVEYVSPNVKKIFGYDAKDFIEGKIKYEDIIHPEDLERISYEARLCGEKYHHFEQEYRIIDAKGKIRWVCDFTIVKKNNGKVTHYHGYVVDITKRKELEKKLEEERKQLVSIFNGIDEPIYVADPKKHEILFANKTLKSLFGEDIVGKKCYKIFQNLDKPCDFCTNDKIFGKNFGKVYIWEFQNMKNRKWYRCIDRGIKWPDGRKVRLEIAIDITDKVKAEEKMREALEKEREFKLRTAHYFFNPIAIAKGYLQLAMDEKNDTLPKIKKAMHAINRIEKVIKNITQKGEITE